MEDISTRNTINPEIIKVLKALADPVRLKIIRDLLEDDRGAERHCSTFGLSVSRATRSHHFKVLREAGLIRVVDKGNLSVAVLRWDEIESEYPGLVQLIKACGTAA